MTTHKSEQEYIRGTLKQLQWISDQVFLHVDNSAKYTPAEVLRLARQAELRDQIRDGASNINDCLTDIGNGVRHLATENQ
jgi:hypothetical protein